MSELPEGWMNGSLGDVLRIRNGYAFKSTEFKESGVPLVRQSNLDGDKVDLSKCVYLEEHYLSERAGFTLYKGDVLIGMSGSVGKLCTYDQSFVALQNQRVGKIELHAADQTEWRFIWHFLKTVTGALLGKAKGVAVANVSPDDIQSLPLNIPPLAEQTRIAAKLDELLAQVDTLKTRIDGIPALLKRFRQSVLAAAVSGRLTEEWREAQTSAKTGADVIRNDQLAKTALLERQPELKKKKSSIESDIDESYLFPLPEGWSFTTWGKISEWITYGFTRPMPKSDAGLKLLTAKDVQRFKLELTSCGWTTTEAFEALSDKDKPAKGDLLITKDGSIGRAALVHTDEEFCINQSVAVCWLRSTTMNKRYLELLSNSDFTQRFVKDKAQGMAIQHLSIIDFAKCPVPVPSNEEQDEIVRRVEQLFAFADQLEARVQAAQARIDRLTQSILAKAFRGELVPQDPNDEPASVLLERINAQRAAAPKAKRGRRAATPS